jgi:hypothetical protein
MASRRKLTRLGGGRQEGHGKAVKSLTNLTLKTYDIHGLYVRKIGGCCASVDDNQNAKVNHRLLVFVFNDRRYMKKTLSTSQFRKWFIKSINSDLAKLSPAERSRRIRAAHAAAIAPDGSKDQISPSTGAIDQRVTHSVAE